MSTPRANPTAIVTYSHSDPGWTVQQVQAREQHVVRLVTVLRSLGIDADADIFHQNEDWTRWGPGQVQRADFVLIVVSKAWKLGWEGTGNPQKHRGTRVEADAVRSIQNEGHDQLQDRCRVILLPDSDEADIPTGMHGLMRHHVRELTPEGVESLLRDLTSQPKYIKSELGQIPVLPPELTSPAPSPTSGATDEAGPVGHAGSQGPSERVEVLREQLAALPLPLPGEGPHLPWFRLRSDLERELAAELEVTGTQGATEATAGTAGGVDWQPQTGINVSWLSQWSSPPAYASPFVVLHMVPLPVVRLSQRVMDSLANEQAEVLRRLAGLSPAQGLTIRHDVQEVTVETKVASSGFNEVHVGQLLGSRMEKSCQVSVWHSLPRDGMGAVLDLDRLTAALRNALAVAAPLVHSTAPGADRVLLAAELAQTTLLTGGTLASLGNRNSTSMPGAMRTPPRMDPDESVPVGSLEGPDADEVARTVAGVLFRAWTR